MRGYVLKRALAAVPVVIVVGIIIFLLMHLIPGDPAAYILGPDATPEEVARLRTELGLDDPLPSQFVGWASRIARGDLGRSIYLKQPVTVALVQRLEPTLMLTFTSMALAVGIAVPAGVLAAARRGTWLDHVLQVVATLGMATPNFWLGLNLAILFAVRLDLLPVAGYRPLSGGVWPSLRYMILPALTLGIGTMASILRMTRTAVLEVLESDYLRTARAKGLPERGVIFRHALRNAMIPIMTVVGLSLAAKMNGAVVTETIFNLPGVGRLFIDAIFRRDYPVVQGVALFTALIYVVVNLLVDLSYAWLDPRVKYA